MFCYLLLSSGEDTEPLTLSHGERGPDRELAQHCLRSSAKVPHGHLATSSLQGWKVSS